MAAIQIGIRGQGTVPDAAVPEIRARVKALVQACADAGAEGLLRVDFSPAEDPIVATSESVVPAPAPASSEPVAEPSAPDVPFEAAVLERPQPQGRAVKPPHEPKVPVDKEDVS